MRTQHRDDGFTLLEAVISMALVVIIFVGLGITINVALRAVQERRAEQQALGVLTGISERFADIEYDNLALNTTDADHTFIPGSTHDHDGPGPLPAEVVAVHADGDVGHLDVVVSGGITFTARTFVTMVDKDPADTSTDDLRRLTTEVTWEVRGLARERQTQTVIAKQASGDALGYAFNLEDNAELVAVRKGDVIEFNNILHNIGTEDDFYDLVFEQETGWSMTFEQQSGFFLDDWNANAIPDTDTIAAGTDMTFKVTVTVPADANPGDFELIHITFISDGDPTRSSVLEYVLEVDPSAAPVGP